MTENTSNDQKYNPLVDEPVFETRDNAVGIKGVEGYKEAGWETMVLKRPRVKTVKGKAVDLDTRQEGYGPIHVQLNWKQAQANGMFEKIKKMVGAGKHIDLDLGCLYELNDGTRGAIQAFGDVYGFYDTAPYVILEGDERDGSGTGEDIYLNGTKWDDIRRVIFYAYIYEGACTWSKTDAVLTVLMADQDPLDIVLEECEDDLPVCAVVKLENINGSMKVTNLEEYFTGHAEMQRAFGFGLNWEQGSKD